MAHFVAFFFFVVADLLCPFDFDFALDDLEEGLELPSPLSSSSLALSLSWILFNLMITIRYMPIISLFGPFSVCFSNISASIPYFNRILLVSTSSGCNSYPSLPFSGDGSIMNLSKNLLSLSILISSPFVCAFSCGNVWTWIISFFCEISIPPFLCVCFEFLKLLLRIGILVDVSNGFLNLSKGILLYFFV